MTEISRLFLDESRRYLCVVYLADIERAVDPLTDEQVWWRPNEEANSIGNLVLHLTGNVRQIRDGNEKAISEYIRLSSLSGITGTFTEVGLTGLPLATIFLTIALSVFGVFNPKFFDLAQLTLGAFIGSYVQKRSELSDSKPASTGVGRDAT